MAGLAGIAGLVTALNGTPAQGAGIRLARVDCGGEGGGQVGAYTANFAEVEQLVIKEFNKRFPEIRSRWSVRRVR